jgi:aminopeptidase N
LSSATSVSFDNSYIPPAAESIFNSDGKGYGLFPTSFEVLEDWGRLGDVEKGSALINLYEQMLLGKKPAPPEYFEALSEIAAAEDNQLLLNLSLGQLRRIFWVLLPTATREAHAPDLELALWEAMEGQTESSMRKIYFDAFSDIASSPAAIQKVYDVWSGALVVDDLPLSENDRIGLCQDLAIKLPDMADEIIAHQAGNTQNPDNRRKLDFIGVR